MIAATAAHHHRQHHPDHARGLLRVTGSPSGALHFWNGAIDLGTTRPQPLHRLPRPADADEVGGT